MKARLHHLTSLLYIINWLCEFRTYILTLINLPMEVDKCFRTQYKILFMGVIIQLCYKALYIVIKHLLTVHKAAVDVSK